MAMNLEQVYQSSTHTSFKGVLFHGRNLNKIMMNTVIQALDRGVPLGVYKGYSHGHRMSLENGVHTTPTKVFIKLSKDYRVCITSSLQGSSLWEIDWGSVGALSFNGNVIWTHPMLTENLNGVVKTQTGVRTKRKSNEPYTNLTEFKKWVSEGKQFRVIEWSGKRNRRGLIMQVTGVVKTKGFYIDAYFNNQLVGDDFIPFLNAPLYHFKKNGVVEVCNRVTNQIEYIIEPV